MELLQLRYFCHAAETQNFSKTAKEFQVPASNISQMVHRLENEIGTTLFDRSANRIYLNEKGKLFYSKIKEALTCISDAEKSAVDDNKMKGEIRIQVCMNRRLITEVIGQFRKLYPNVTFILNFNNDIKDCDLLISEKPYNTSMDKIKLVEEKILLAVEEKQSDNISKDSLKSLKFITMGKGSSVHKITREICKAKGFEPNIIIQSDDPYYLREYVSLGLGVAFIPEKSWKGQFPDNVKFLNVGDYKRITYVYRPKNRYVSKAADTFLEMLIKASKKY